MKAIIELKEKVKKSSRPLTKAEKKKFEGHDYAPWLFLDEIEFNVGLDSPLSEFFDENSHTIIFKIDFQDSFVTLREERDEYGNWEIAWYADIKNIENFIISSGIKPDEIISI